MHDDRIIDACDPVSTSNLTRFEQIERSAIKVISDFSIEMAYVSKERF